MADRLGRVLVVDDNEDDHLQIGRLLRDEFQVSGAYTGAEALERLQHEAFDVLVTDQKMPRMSGDELIRRIKEDDRIRNLRCVLLSGRTSDQQLVEILKRGHVFHYFEKNKTLLKADGRADLLMAVRNAVQASLLERERELLTERLRAQMDAVSSQHKLVRALLVQKDPTVILRLVVESLARRLRCRATFCLVDLSPNQGAFAHLAGSGERGFTTGDEQAWSAWGARFYERLAGRELPEVPQLACTPEAVEEGELTLPPDDEAHHLPVFLNRDLRGLIVICRGAGESLAADELELFEIWREQLQDALTRVHSQLLDQQRRVELMVETMNEGVVLTDEEGVVTLINPFARRLLGVQDAERPDFTVILRSLGLSSVDVLRQLAVGEGKVSWRELEVGGAWYQVLFAHVRDASGAVVGVLTVIREVTEQKRAEHQREEFVHIVGHELRSPLTSIGGVLDLLAKQVLGELSDRQREYVEMAKDSCVKINHILNDLLDLAKFEKGKMPLALEAVNLEQVVLETVRKFEPVGIDKGIEMAFDCELEGLYTQADAYRLGQVMNNLLSNALKFTPSGGRVGATVFTSFTAPEHYLVAVHNTGEEIGERDLDRIFDKFEQVEVQDRRSVGGTGLGLSICRSIIQGHGGEIWVESGRGEGTTFVFSLPAGGATGLVRDDGRDTVPNADGRPLLLVCADRDEAYGLKSVLLQLDFRVRPCSPRVDDIREQVLSLEPALAIYLDVDGHPDEAALAELAAHNELPVVAMLPLGTPAPPTVDLTIELPPEPVVLASLLNVVLARQRQQRRMRVLVIDGESGWADDAMVALEEAGYLAFRADARRDAVRRIETHLPDLLIFASDSPALGEVMAHLRSEGEDDVAVLLLGAEPEQIEELGLPATSALPRDADARTLLVSARASLTGKRRSGLDTLIVLPGARELQREVQSRIRDQQPYAYCAIDIEGLDQAIDDRGFMWGHGAMAHTAELIHRVLRDHADQRAFLGHQRDDDFVLIVGPDHCEAVCVEIERAFEQMSTALGGPDARRLGLRITAVLDDSGRFERFSALQAHLTRHRARQTGERVVIDRHTP